MIEIKTNAVKQVIKRNDISAEKHDAVIISSKSQGTVSIILKTNPAIGIAVTRKDLLKALGINE